ncbi:gtpase slip-gc [Fusarium albosuccineum]|uniref:Gtpase slip-gc n=1 Tax=Fusarium albosuccineum TaxID=1237068 RepID=A0A8H4PGX2_9HYPO|nr:gtpase slip-gc [Fusarium albosuccineum]
MSSRTPQSRKHGRAPIAEMGPLSEPNKRQATESSAVQRQPDEFRWVSCQNKTVGERLQTKQKAVNMAHRFSEETSRILERAMHKMPAESDDGDAEEVMGQKVLQRWLEDFNKIRMAREGFEVLVGVEGPLGAGKSSFLAALLRMEDLLPPGQHQAGTTVLTKISWNWDDRPENAFWARIVFRKKRLVQKEVEQILHDLSLQPQGADAGPGLSRITAVWGIEQAELTDMLKHSPAKQAAELVLQRNPEALGLLKRQTLSFSAQSALPLSNLVRSYLQPTPGLPGPQLPFPAWPLVDHVQFFVKADILKTGITLVDLPGYGDATVSRSEVAKTFSQTLDVRVVVTPTARAADEEKAVNLMRNGFDEAYMIASGKFDREAPGFGVILSKIDALDVDQFLKNELSGNIEIQKRRTELQSVQQQLRTGNHELQTMKRRVDKKRKKEVEIAKTYRDAIRTHIAQLKVNSNANDEQLQTLERKQQQCAQEYEEALQKVQTHEAGLVKLKAHASRIHDSIHYGAIWMRYQLARSAIQERLADILRKYDTGRGLNQITGRLRAPTTLLPSLLPVSTQAFSKFKQGCTPMPGFPTAESTGVPSAERWIYDATLKKRERHLDYLLAGLQGLLDTMRTYSQGTEGVYTMSRTTVETSLEPIHQGGIAELDAQLMNSAKQVLALNPLEYWTKASENFASKAPEIAARWGYRAEGNKRLAFNTFNAILRNNGIWRSTVKSPQDFNWIELLVDPIMGPLAVDWDLKMNQQLLAAKAPMVQAFSASWAQYLDRLEGSMVEQLEPLAPAFNRLRPSLDALLRKTEARIGNALENLSLASSVIFRSVTRHLRATLMPLFKEALELVGDGAYEKKRELLIRRMEQDARSFCDKALHLLALDLKAKTELLLDELQEIAKEAVGDVMHQISDLINNTIEIHPMSSPIQQQKVRLQKSILPVLEQWESAWRLGEQHILNRGVRIPEAVPAIASNGAGA